MADDIQNLILNVQGRDQVEALRAAILQEEDALRKLIAAHGQNDAATRQSAAVIKDLQKELEVTQNLTRSTTTHTRNYQQAALAASYALQDATSANGGWLQALNSVNNNIPQIVTGLGGPTGMVAWIGALSTATILAAPHVVNYVKELKIFGDAAKGTKTQIELLHDKIKELESKPTKLAIDVTALDEAKRKLKELEAGQRAFEAAKEGKSVPEKQAGDRIRKTFEDAGDEYKNVQSKMVDIKAGELQVHDKEYQDAIKSQERAKRRIQQLETQISDPRTNPEARDRMTTDIEAANEAIKKADAVKRDRIKAIRDNAEAQIGDLRTKVEAGNDPKARATLAGYLRQAGAEGLATATELYTPEAFREEDEAKKEEEIHQEQQRQLERRNKEAKDLEDQGRAASDERREKMAGQAEQDAMNVFSERWKDSTIRARVAGAGKKEEEDRLRPEVTDAIRKMSPELEREFPRAIEGVVNGIILKTREAVDKEVRRRQATEHLTPDQALRRMGQEQARKGQEADEKLVTDEFARFGGVMYGRQAQMFPGMAKLTPEMRQQLGKQMQQQFEEMGVSPKEQMTIARSLNSTIGNPRAEAAREQSMAALMGTGLFDEAGAMRQMPNMFQLLNRGVAIPQATQRIAEQLMRQQRDAAEERAAEQGRTARKPKSREGGGLRSIPPTAPGEDGEGLGSRMAVMSGQNLANTGKLLAVTGQHDGELARLQQQMTSLSAAVDRQFNRTRARTRTAQKRGN